MKAEDTSCVVELEVHAVVDLVVGQRYVVLVDGVPACAVVVVMGMRVHDCKQHRNRHSTRDACGNGFSRSPQCLVKLNAHEQRQRFASIHSMQRFVSFFKPT